MKLATEMLTVVTSPKTRLPLPTLIHTISNESLQLNALYGRRSLAEVTMEPELDISNATPFSSTQVFEQAATTADEHGVQICVPQRFVTRTGQRVTDMSLDTLT